MIRLLPLVLMLTTACGSSARFQDRAEEARRLKAILGLVPELLLARLDAEVLPIVPEDWEEGTPLVGWSVVGPDDVLDPAEDSDLPRALDRWGDGLQVVIVGPERTVWAMAAQDDLPATQWPILRLTPDGASLVEAANLRDFLALALHGVAQLDPLAAREAWWRLALGASVPAWLALRTEQAQDLYAELEYAADPPPEEALDDAAPPAEADEATGDEFEEDPESAEPEEPPADELPGDELPADELPDDEPPDDEPPDEESAPDRPPEELNEQEDPGPAADSEVVDDRP